jgi:hypothetical protein
LTPATLRTRLLLRADEVEFLTGLRQSRLKRLLLLTPWNPT